MSSLPSESSVRPTVETTRRKENAMSDSCIPDLTIEEMAALTSGATAWTTKAIDRCGIDSIRVSDGPHGLRKQTAGADNLGIGGSLPATCFPPAVALGSSFDPELVGRVGAAIALEAAIEDVAVVLGPGINIKRSPLCGRNFEYFSEDPLVSGILGAAYVQGVQGQGVGVSLKHFAANNQEHDRMRVSADIDPRPLREIYLRAFERVVKVAAPWTVMCSYNRINGIYASENPWLLTQVLREDWGFDGVVISDWGAVNDRVAGLAAGLDLEMPSSDGRTDAELVEAVESGLLEVGQLERSAARIIDLVGKAGERPVVTVPLDVSAHHSLAREAAGRSIVLLKNDKGTLPLARSQKVAVIGAFAAEPRYQGAGSSIINPTRVDVALDAMRLEGGANVVYAQGFEGSGAVSAHAATALRDEAVAVAAGADVAVMFLGLPDTAESEGFDRETIDLPEDQLALLAAVRHVMPRTVVVLSHGGVVAMPFADTVPTIVEGWLLGQAGGSAIADVLYGRVNPSGKLTETIPIRIEDSPSFGNYPGESGHVRYGEGILVGYRGYDARGLDVTFPFGHGLSFTTFAYGDAAATMTKDGDVLVQIVITNTGSRDGREVVQVYASLEGSRVQRAPRELVAFASVALSAGASQTLTLHIRREDLAFWDIRVNGWTVEGGRYSIEVGASSRDIRSKTTLWIEGDEVRFPLSLDSSISEVMAHPVTGPTMRRIVSEVRASLAGTQSATASMMQDEAAAMKMMASIPIGRATSFATMPMSREDVLELLARAEENA